MNIQITKSITQDNSQLIKEIAIFWHIRDIQARRYDLTDEQASAVLLSLKKNYDAEIGINWEFIDIAAEILFPEADAGNQDKINHD